MWFFLCQFQPPQLFGLWQSSHKQSSSSIKAHRRASRPNLCYIKHLIVSAFLIAFKFIVLPLLLLGQLPMSSVMAHAPPRSSDIQRAMVTHQLDRFASNPYYYPKAQPPHTTRIDLESWLARTLPKNTRVRNASTEHRLKAWPMSHSYYQPRQPEESKVANDKASRIKDSGVWKTLLRLYKSMLGHQELPKLIKGTAHAERKVEPSTSTAAPPPPPPPPSSNEGPFGTPIIQPQGDQDSQPPAVYIHRIGPPTRESFENMAEKPTKEDEFKFGVVHTGPDDGDDDKPELRTTNSIQAPPAPEVFKHYDRNGNLVGVFGSFYDTDMAKPNNRAVQQPRNLVSVHKDKSRSNKFRARFNPSPELPGKWHNRPVIPSVRMLRSNQTQYVLSQTV